MSDRRSMPFDEWPTVYQELWQRASAASGGWLDMTRVGMWAPRTRIKAIKSCGRVLQWSSDNNLLDAGPWEGFPFRIEVLKQFVAAERSFVTFGTLSNQLFHIIAILESAMPDGDWSEFRKLRGKLKRLAHREPRQQPPIVHASRTLELGRELIRQGLDRDLADEAAVDLYLDGLLIAMLTLVYLRIGNFAALELDRHLTRGRELWLLTVASDETKNKHADNGALPDFFAPWLDYYVDVIRPELASRARRNANTQRLWLDAKGRWLTDQAIRKRIKRRTKEAFGFAISPHTFRKIALTTFVIERPEYAAWGPALLRHHSPKTAEKHYFVAQGQLAIETYHEIRRMRRKHRKDDAAANAKDQLREKIQLLVLCNPPALGRRIARKGADAMAAPKRRSRSRLGRGPSPPSRSDEPRDT